MDFTAQDQQWMQLALAQAEQAAIAGEVPVGAVLVLDDKVIGQDHNRTIMNHDPTAHAEVMVLRQAATMQRNHRLLSGILYVTLEPCIMCVGAIIQARIERLVYATSDPNSGAVGSVMNLSAHPQLNHAFTVKRGLMAEESAKLLRDFFTVRR